MPIRKEMRGRYPKDWPQRSRFVRFYRARNHCEWCNAKNHTRRKDTGAKVVLAAAHVYDKRPEACSLLNLAALCQQCHNRHDGKDRAKGKGNRRDRFQLRFWQRPCPACGMSADYIKEPRRYLLVCDNCGLSKAFIRGWQHLFVDHTRKADRGTTTKGGDKRPFVGQ